jgi:hypothetical protein
MAITIGSNGCHISDTNFAHCGGSDIANSQGTILQERPMSGIYSGLNFSDNSLSLESGAGSAFEAGCTWGTNAASIWSLSYCTFCHCSGKSIVEGDNTKGTSVSSISYCNFYDNSVGIGGSIIYVTITGVSFDNCIFGVGSQFDLPLIGGTITEDKFIFTNCIFPKSITNTNQADIGEGCSVDAAATSHELIHFDDCFYSPTPNPTMSPTV